jgi:hypothetical protein
VRLQPAMQVQINPYCEICATLLHWTPVNIGLLAVGTVLIVCHW